MRTNGGSSSKTRSERGAKAGTREERCRVRQRTQLQRGRDGEALQQYERWSSGRHGTQMVGAQVQGSSGAKGQVAPSPRVKWRAAR